MKDSGKFVARSSKLIEGDEAPYFDALNELGERITLADFKQKRLLLYFYPKDNTPTCTIQACNIRDHYSELTKLDVAVLGVSADSVASHAKFLKKQNFRF